MAKDYVEDMETGAKFPLDYSWHSVNNFVFSADVSFEDLQACCLGLAAKLEAAQQMRALDLLSEPSCCASFVLDGTHHRDCRLAQTASQ